MESAGSATGRQRSLFAALHSGDADTFVRVHEETLSSSPDFRVERCTAGKTGDTVLHVASRLGADEALEYLRRRVPGLNLSVQNLEGKTPLHEAAQARRESTVRWLLRGRGAAPVDPIKRADWTPLMLACTKADNLPVVAALVGAGADLTLANKDGWTAFHLACRVGDVEIMDHLLSASGSASGASCWDTRSKNGRTPLHSSAQAGDLRSLEWLLDRCPFPADEADSCGSTPLMDAVRSGRADCARLLIGREHRPGATDKMGRNCLHVACHAGRLELVDFLVGEHGMELGSASGNGMTPLHWAALEDQAPVVRALVEAGADVAVRDGRGRTALDVASASGCAQSAELLSAFPAPGLKE